MERRKSTQYFSSLISVGSSLFSSPFKSLMTVFEDFILRLFFLRECSTRQSSLGVLTFDFRPPAVLRLLVASFEAEFKGEPSISTLVDAMRLFFEGLRGPGIEPLLDIPFLSNISYLLYFNSKQFTCKFLVATVVGAVAWSCQVHCILRELFCSSISSHNANHLSRSRMPTASCQSLLHIIQVGFVILKPCLPLASHFLSSSALPTHSSHRPGKIAIGGSGCKRIPKASQLFLVSWSTWRLSQYSTGLSIGFRGQRCSVVRMSLQSVNPAHCRLHIFLEYTCLVEVCR